MTRPDLAAVAASQFERRRAWLRRQVAAGAIAPAAANDRARPWLAIAWLARAASSSAAVGDKSSDLPELAGLRFADIAPRVEALQVLAAAADTALRAHLAAPTERTEREATELMALAVALRAGPPIPSSSRPPSRDHAEERQAA